MIKNAINIAIKANGRDEDLTSDCFDPVLEFISFCIVKINKEVCYANLFID